MSSHLKLGAGVADLVDIGQRTSVVRCPSLRQTELLNLLKLHLRVKNKSTPYYRTYRRPEGQRFRVKARAFALWWSFFTSEKLTQRPELGVPVTQAEYSALKQKLLQNHKDPTFGSFPVPQKR